MVNQLTQIKQQLKQLYETNPDVHIDVFFKKERKRLENIPARITAVYPNLFSALLYLDDGEKIYTFQYVDILIHSVAIKELNII